jgi:hypothetical protein
MCAARPRTLNRWNIPDWLEQEVLVRDIACIYCGVDFSFPVSTRGTKPSWEHIVNDARIVTRENIARCCISCNASKGAQELEAWLQSKYCKRKCINKASVAQVVRNALSIPPAYASA